MPKPKELKFEESLGRLEEIVSQLESKEAPLDQRAGLLAGPLKEGHELFFSRVTTALASVFDEAIASILTPLMGVELKSLAPSPRPALGQPIVQSGGSNNTLGVVVAIALLGAVAAFFFLRGH